MHVSNVFFFHHHINLSKLFSWWMCVWVISRVKTDLVTVLWDKYLDHTHIHTHTLWPECHSPQCSIGVGSCVCHPACVLALFLTVWWFELPAEMCVGVCVGACRYSCTAACLFFFPLSSFATGGRFKSDVIGQMLFLCDCLWVSRCGNVRYCYIEYVSVYLLCACARAVHVKH